MTFENVQTVVDTLLYDRIIEATDIPHAVAFLVHYMTEQMVR